MKCPKCGADMVVDNHRRYPIEMCYQCGYMEGQNIEIGLDEYIEGDGACFIEWPQFIEPLLPDEKMEIILKNEGGDQRSITFTSDCPRFEKIIEQLGRED